MEITLGDGTVTLIPITDESDLVQGVRVERNFTEDSPEVLRAQESLLRAGVDRGDDRRERMGI